MMKPLIAALFLAASALMAGDRAPQRPINLNTATATELTQLPRIGSKTAERIVAWRKQHGAFQRPEELMNVKGIGEKGYAKLRPHLLVSAPAKAAPTAKPAGK